MAVKLIQTFARIRNRQVVKQEGDNDPADVYCILPSTDDIRGHESHNFWELLDNFTKYIPGQRRKSTNVTQVFNESGIQGKFIAWINKMESGKTFVKKDFDKTDKAKDKAILKNFFSKGNSKLNRYIKSLYIERRRATRKA